MSHRIQALTQPTLRGKSLAISPSYLQETERLHQIQGPLDRKVPRLVGATYKRNGRPLHPDTFDFLLTSKSGVLPTIRAQIRRHVLTTILDPRQRATNFITPSTERTVHKTKEQTTAEFAKRGVDVQWESSLGFVTGAYYLLGDRREFDTAALGDSAKQIQSALGIWPFLINPISVDQLFWLANTLLLSNAMSADKVGLSSAQSGYQNAELALVYNQLFSNFSFKPEELGLLYPETFGLRPVNTGLNKRQQRIRKERVSDRVHAAQLRFRGLLLNTMGYEIKRPHASLPVNEWEKVPALTPSSQDDIDPAVLQKPISSLVDLIQTDFVLQTALNNFPKVGIETIGDLLKYTDNIPALLGLVRYNQQALGIRHLGRKQILNLDIALRKLGVTLEPDVMRRV
jgi:hypothetical protein